MDAEVICNRFDSLVNARRSQDNLMQDIGRLVTPYRAEFYKPLTSSNEVQWYRGEVFDATAVANCNLLASKMHTNLTSPTVPWFDLTFRDDALNETKVAKEWLQDTVGRARQALQESDFNTEIAEIYLDLVAFGTSLLMLEEKDDVEWKGIDFSALPVQDSYFEMGGDNLPSRVYRKIRMTKLQIEERFDIPDDFAWPQNEDEKNVDTRYDIIFCVYYRDRDKEVTGIMKPEDRPVGYKYVFKARKHQLEEGGYYQYPAMVVRWQKCAGTDWGFSPSMVAMPDIRQLNEVVAQNAEARSKHIDPPLKTTSRGIIEDTDIGPGALIMVEEMDELAPLYPPIDMRPGIEEQERLQEALGRYYYLDMLQMKESPAMTATEVRVRYEEIMSMMAPTLGRLQNDLLKPLIEIVVTLLNRKGRLSEMPTELAGADLDIVFTSPLARAQKGDMARGLEIWMGNVLMWAEANPAVLDIPDMDMVARMDAELNGVPAKATRDQAEVNAGREARAEQEQAMQQLQMAEQAGGAIEKAGKGAQALQVVE